MNINIEIHKCEKQKNLTAEISINGEYFKSVGMEGPEEVEGVKELMECIKDSLSRDEDFKYSPKSITEVCEEGMPESEKLTALLRNYLRLKPESQSFFLKDLNSRAKKRRGRPRHTPLEKKKKELERIEAKLDKVRQVKVMTSKRGAKSWDNLAMKKMELKQEIEDLEKEGSE